MKKILIILSFICILLTGCVEVGDYVSITNGSNIDLEINETIKLEYIKTANVIGDAVFTSSTDAVLVDNNGLLTARKEGKAIVTLTIGTYKDEIIINVTNSLKELKLTISKNELYIGDTLTLNVELISNKINSLKIENATFEIIGKNDTVEIINNTLTAKNIGSVNIKAKYNDYESNTVFVNIQEEDITTDPYIDMSYTEFYENYSEATSYMDAYYRTLHGFMSGSIEKQNEKPTTASYMPKENDMYIRNTNAIYSTDKNTYYVVDGYGNIVNEVYKGGAYVTLEEVAAYLFAFGDVPANYITKKSGSPSSSIWKEYLRLNHSSFSGNTTKYKYEPALPNIRGNGGELYYYEVDLGTTGTTCDPNYDILPYNNGSKITRGAARIVYTRYDKNKDEIIDINEKYLFYTYNHYNDFQEYLNYEGGWGEMFGNITGGGTLSSNTNYNPTPYVSVARKDFIKVGEELNISYFNSEVIYYFKEEYIYY